MDLAVDEQGLWVLFGSTGNNRQLYAYKIDVIKNSVTHTWSLSTGKERKTTTNSRFSKRELYLGDRCNKTTLPKNAPGTVQVSEVS